MRSQESRRDPSRVRRPGRLTNTFREIKEFCASRCETKVSDTHGYRTGNAFYETMSPVDQLMAQRAA